MNKFYSFGVIFLIISLVSGCCAARKVVSEPGKITLQEAIVEVAEALNKMQDAGKDYPKLGLVPSEVTVVFNISADAKDTNKLYIEAGAAVADVLEIAKAGAEKGSEINVKRGNQVTIKFSNIFLADSKEALIRNKSPKEIAQLLEVLKNAGYVPVIKMQVQ